MIKVQEEANAVVNYPRPVQLFWDDFENKVGYLTLKPSYSRLTHFIF